MGSRDSSVVWAPDSWLKGHGFRSVQEHWENFLIEGQLSVLLLWHLFHARVTTVVHKRSQSFCQQCRWHVTAEHTSTLHVWLWMKWHSAWCTQNVPRQQQFHVAPAMQRCKYTTSVDIQNRAIKRSLMQDHMWAQSVCSRVEKSPTKCDPNKQTGTGPSLWPNFEKHSHLPKLQWYTTKLTLVAEGSAVLKI